MSFLRRHWCEQLFLRWQEKWDPCFCFNLGCSLIEVRGLNLKMELDLQGINVLLMLCIMCGSNSCDAMQTMQKWEFYVINIVLQSARMQENASRYFLCVQLKPDMSDLITLVMHILHFFSSLFTPPSPNTPPAAMHDGQARYCAWHLQQVLVGASFPLLNTLSPLWSHVCAIELTTQREHLLHFCAHFIVLTLCYEALCWCFFTSKQLFS